MENRSVVSHLPFELARDIFGLLDVFHIAKLFLCGNKTLCARIFNSVRTVTFPHCGRALPGLVKHLTVETMIFYHYHDNSPCSIQFEDLPTSLKRLQLRNCRSLKNSTLEFKSIKHLANLRSLRFTSGILGVDWISFPSDLQELECSVLRASIGTLPQGLTSLKTTTIPWETGFLFPSTLLHLYVGRLVQNLNELWKKLGEVSELQTLEIISYTYYDSPDYCDWSLAPRTLIKLFLNAPVYPETYTNGMQVWGTEGCQDGVQSYKFYPSNRDNTLGPFATVFQFISRDCIRSINLRLGDKCITKEEILLIPPNVTELIAPGFFPDNLSHLPNLKKIDTLYWPFASSRDRVRPNKSFRNITSLRLVDWPSGPQQAPEEFELPPRLTSIYCNNGTIFTAEIVASLPETLKFLTVPSKCLPSHLYHLLPKGLLTLSQITHANSAETPSTEPATPPPKSLTSLNLRTMYIDPQLPSLLKNHQQLTLLHLVITSTELLPDLILLLPSSITSLVLANFPANTQFALQHLTALPPSLAELELRGFSQIYSGWLRISPDELHAHLPLRLVQLTLGTPGRDFISQLKERNLPIAGVRSLNITGEKYMFKAEERKWISFDSEDSDLR